MKEKSHTWIYVVIAIVIVALMAVGVARFRQEKDTREAHAKAKQLIAALQTQGFPTPDEDVVVSLFGTDGGPLCENPDSDYLQSLLTMRIANGSERRPVILDARFFQAEAIILSIYCPEKLPDFKEYVDSLKLEDTTP